MTTKRHFSIRWAPHRPGRVALRVVTAAGAGRAGGVSRVWRHRVDPETVADIARDILRDAGITLATVHLSAGNDGATALQNMIDVARGRPVRRSCHGNAPCGHTAMDLQALRAVREMGVRGTVTVSEFAGGNHASGSAHYAGRAVDITWVNGRHVGPGTNDRMVVDVCHKHGASEVFSPSRDPYGGHHNHVHCAWV